MTSRDFEVDLRSLGEKGFLSGLLGDLFVDPRLIGGFGHDASVIAMPDSPFDLIQKIDRASRPVALSLGLAGYETWGRMAVTANCSDILASGGRPLSVMIAIMVPGEETAANVRDIVFGAAAECRRHGVVFAGGDTKEAADAHVVGTAIGTVGADRFLPRNTARPGDRVFCAGRVGGFAGSYFLIRDVHQGEARPEAEGYIEYLSTPTAQWRTAGVVNAGGYARCGMDASDGLLDVLQTFAAAGVRIEIELDAVPYHTYAVECAKATSIPLTQLMFGGGDWNILYCVPDSRADELVRVAEAEGLPLFQIGRVTEGEGVVAVDRDGVEFALRGVVNEHFKNRIEDAGSFMDHIEKDNFLV
ncbi:thiamine-phosphate kinase [Catellatospora paridis]|uniref:thiamine-phosphate kinase n=1 Tax=Catellatospora paridis TaxID=1617086 RepID=UPI0018AFE5BC|nr:thiamine-phosphate kinase [Catellatospora paridis]